MVGEIPAPRRLVTGHKPSGEPAVIDDTIPTKDVGGGFATAPAFTQTSYEVDPVEAVNGATREQEGMVLPGGIYTRWVDVPPHTTTGMHFTNTIDYLVFTHGNWELVLHDGSKRKVGPSDVVIQLANIHQWNNVGDTWGRFVAIVLPSSGVKVDGKTLDEAPFSAQRWA